MNTGKILKNEVEDFKDKLSFAAKFDPLNTRYINYQGQLLIVQGVENNESKLIEQGFELINKVFKINPYDNDNYDIKIKMLLQLKKYDEAIETCDDMLAVFPLRPEPYIYKARAYVESGFEKKNKQYFNNALEVYKQAKTLMDSISKERLKYWNYYTHLNNYPELNYWVGISYMILGNYKEGQAKFKLASIESSLAENYNIKEWLTLATLRINKKPDSESKDEKVVEFGKLIDSIR